MRRTAMLLAILALVALGWRWQASTLLRASAGAAQLDPLKVAPDTHKLLFENPFVRVLEVHVPPGKTEPWHEHSRRVVIYLSDFHTRVTEKGGQPRDTLRKRGLVRWSEPLVHQVENIGRTEGHVISVELK